MALHDRVATPSCATSLKEINLSRGSLAFFEHTFRAKAVECFFGERFVVSKVPCRSRSSSVRENRSRGTRTDMGCWIVDRHSRSCLRGCRAVLFFCGCTPTHPFVVPPAFASQVAQVQCLAPNSLCDRLADTYRLNQAYAWPLGPSPSGTADWLGVARASSFSRKEGPMQPSAIRVVRHPVLC